MFIKNLQCGGNKTILQTRANQNPSPILMYYQMMQTPDGSCCWQGVRSCYEFFAAVSFFTEEQDDLKSIRPLMNENIIMSDIAFFILHLICNFFDALKHLNLTNKVSNKICWEEIHVQSTLTTMSFPFHSKKHPKSTKHIKFLNKSSWKKKKI